MKCQIFNDKMDNRDNEKYIYIEGSFDDFIRRYWRFIGSPESNNRPKYSVKRDIGRIMTLKFDSNRVLFCANK